MSKKKVETVEIEIVFGLDAEGEWQWCSLDEGETPAESLVNSFGEPINRDSVRVLTVELPAEVTPSKPAPKFRAKAI